MTTFSKQLLSASTNGRCILIASTGSAVPTTVHTSVNSGSLDEIWLWANNTATSSISMSVTYGGTTSPDDIIQLAVSPRDGLLLVIPGTLLQSGSVVGAFTNIANTVIVSGFINRITNS